MKSPLVVAAAALSACCAACVFAAAPSARGLIVKLKDAPSHESAQALGRGAPHPDAQRWQRVLDESGVVPKRMRATGRASQLLEFDRVLSGDEAGVLAASLRRRADVEWVVPNERERRLQSTTPPNDPLFAPQPGQTAADAQWWLYAPSGSDGNVLADRLRGVPGFVPAWASSTGVAQARVAVVDTGITSHTDLDGRILPGYDFVSEVDFANDGDGRDADASDPGDWVSLDDLARPLYSQSNCVAEISSWHGTGIAGQIAALTNNGQGVAAISWNGSIVPVRVAGKCGATVADIIDGMRWAGGLSVAGVPANPNPARIVNISFGGSDPCNAAYQSAIDELATVGAVVVAAAGNEHGAPTRPASCNNVLGVAALNRDGFKASYSNFGPTLAIATVGGDPSGQGRWGSFVGDSGLLTIYNEGLQQPGQPIYSYLVGTSFATPLVAGAASLMLSVNPSLSASQLIQGLKASARPHVVSTSIGPCSDANPGRCLCSTSTCGAGILDAERALQFAAGLTPGPLSPAQIDNADVRAAAATGPDLDPNAGAGGGAGAGAGGGGGGGALNVGWLAGLALAVLALARPGRRRG